MNCNRDEAMKAMELAEAKFAEKNYTLVKKLAQKAQSMCPEIDGISQFLDAVDVFISYEVKNGALTDWYNVLGVSPTCGEEMIKQRYRKMARSLHPDKNKSIGSTDAFKIMAEAFEVLSDKAKRSEYDAKRRLNLQQEKNYCNDKFNGDLSSTTCTEAPNHHQQQQKQASDEAPNCDNPTGFGRFRSRWEARKPAPFNHQQGSTASHENPDPTGFGRFRSRWEARKHEPFHHQQGPAASHENPNPTGLGQFRSRWEARKAAPSHHQQGFPSSYYRQQPNAADSHHHTTFFPGNGQASSSSVQPTPAFSNYYVGQRADSQPQMNMGSSSAGSRCYWSGVQMNLRPNINLDLGSNQYAQIRTEDMRHPRQVNNNLMKRPSRTEQSEEGGNNGSKRRNAEAERCSVFENKFSNFNNNNDDDPGNESSTNIGDSLNRRMNDSWIKF